MNSHTSDISGETAAFSGASPAQTGLIGLVAAGNEAFLVQQGALEALADTGFCLVLLPNGQAQIGQFIGNHRPAGLLLAAPLLATGGLAEFSNKAGINTVCISPDPSNDPAHLVCSNDRQGASDAVAYLLALGHRRIGFVSGPESCRAARERELGYIDALADHRLDLGAELATQGDGSVESGHEAGRLLLAVSPRPTAILAGSDAMAAGVLKAAHELGVAVPDQLSVMGFGDAPLAEACWPPLTTMRLPWAEMGFTAAIKLIDPERAETMPVEFFCELVTRSSTGPVG